ncbi:NAD(+)--rifampin ADP-ribosyltransferase, partial [Kitasatospora albolonga]
PRQPTRSYRSRQPLRVVAELREWQGTRRESCGRCTTTWRR